jgi:protein phosphatase
MSALPRPEPENEPVPMRLAWSGMTHRGKIRPNNEDSFVAFTFDGRQTRYLGKIGEASTATSDFVFAVSDGMGGGSLGEFASRRAVERLTEYLPKSFKLSAAGLSSGFHDLLSEVFVSIHKDLIKLGRSYEECATMGTTLSLCWFTPKWMYFGHVGDSRVYYLPKSGKLTQVTHDHSQVGWLRRTGRINEREARMHPARNSLQQALGAGHQFVDPHVGSVGFQPGDRFLVCSDGLTDGLWDRRIEEILGSDKPVGELATTLVHASVEDSGRDNTTAVVVEVLPDRA